MKKILAVLLSLVMILAGGTAALASGVSGSSGDETSTPYSITVNNAKAGETYTAYKMLDLSYNSATNAYRYTVNSAWSGFTNNEAFTNVFTVSDQGYVTAKEGINTEAEWSALTNLSKLAKAAAKYAKDNNITAVGSVKIADSATSGTIALTEPGYYIVTSTLGTRAMTWTAPPSPEASFTEKNAEDTIAKTVKEDSTGAYGESNDAQIGDTIEFKSVVTVVPRSVNVKIHDTMDSGLTLNADSIKIYTDENLTQEYTGATVRAGSDANAPDTDDTFTIEIPDTFAATAENSQTLYIVYTAELNKNAVAEATTPATGYVINNQTNKTWVSFGDTSKSVESATTTTTHSVTIFKHAANSEDNLANAIFQLKKGTGDSAAVVNLVKLDATNYRVVDDTETGTASSHVAKDNEGNPTGEVATIAANSIVSDFVTVSSGKITIWGLDSDSDYTITELQAPAGYNLLANPVTLTYNTDTTDGKTVGFAEANIINNTGAELPSTGGIGTTLFYVVGGVLVAAAAVFLVVRRRMGSGDGTEN